MEALIENCHSDIRLILNTLQARHACEADCFAKLTPPPQNKDAPLELNHALF